MTWNEYSNASSSFGTSTRRDRAKLTSYIWPDIRRLAGVNSTVRRSSQMVFPLTEGLKEKSFTLVSWPTEAESKTSCDRTIRTVEPELTVPDVKDEIYSPNAGLTYATAGFVPLLLVA